MKKIFATILIAAAAFTACEREMIVQTSGDIPSLEGTDATFIEVRSSRTLSNVIPVTFIEGGTNVMEYISARASKPLAFAEALTVEVDEALVETFAQEQGLEGAVVLPKHFYDFEDGGAFMVEAGEKNSSSKKLQIYAVNAIGNVLPAGIYVLPVRAGSFSRDLKAQTLYYVITVAEEFETMLDVYTGDEVFTVFYLNTDDYDPRLVTEFYFKKRAYDSSFEDPGVWSGAMGNILNLRTVLLDHDAVTGRAILNLGNNMTHILSNADTYIESIRQGGRKICISVEGGGKGLGFCNLSDSQIADFVQQVKVVLDAYDLDGINLWDRYSGYGKEGMPPMNTTSYPKLIKALREVLGPEKLITVTDHMEPTEYFWDTEATGGIAVGDYIDYAWSGYQEKDTRYWVVDPWHQDAEMVETQFPRKPMAGLDPSRYGCLMAGWFPSRGYDLESRTQGETDLRNWVSAGYKQSNIMVYEDLKTHTQDQYEGSWRPTDVLVYFMEDAGHEPGKFMYESMLYRWNDTPTGYYKWKKDW